MRYKYYTYLQSIITSFWERTFGEPGGKDWQDCGKHLILLWKSWTLSQNASAFAFVPGLEPLDQRHKQHEEHGAVQVTLSGCCIQRQSAECQDGRDTETYGLSMWSMRTIMSQRIPLHWIQPSKNTRNNRPHKGAKPKGCWLKDGQCIAANAFCRGFEGSSHNKIWGKGGWTQAGPNPSYMDGLFLPCLRILMLSGPGTPLLVIHQAKLQMPAPKTCISQLSWFKKFACSKI